MTLLVAELLLLYLIVELRTRRYKTAGIERLLFTQNCKHYTKSTNFMTNISNAGDGMSSMMVAAGSKAVMSSSYSPFTIGMPATIGIEKNS